MTNWFKKLIEKIWEVLEHWNPTPEPIPPVPPSPPGPTPASIDSYVGYGVVNYWMGISSEELADLLAENRCTITHVEFLGWGSKEYYLYPSALFPKLREFIASMRRRNITTFVNIINWNYEENGGICHSRFDDTWFASILDFFIGEIGTDNVILQPVSEWGGGRNKQCDSKAKRWCDLTASKWVGLKSWNKGARPASAPNGWMREYHPFKTSDVGKNFCIVTTDTSSILVELSKDGKREGFANPDKLRAYAKKVRAARNGFIYYGFGHKMIDKDAIKALKGITNG